ncbi:MAG: hypothetical protein AABZ15_10830 [Nitrospirota bacterium]
MVRRYRKISISLFTVLITLLLASSSFAAGLCCQLSSGVQESLSGVAAPASEEISVQFTYSFTRMDKLKQGTSAKSLDEASASTSYTSLPVSMDMIKYTFTAGYGFSSRFKGFVSIPYLRNTMNMTMSNGVGLGWMDMTMEPISATGDATVMGLYRIYTDSEIWPNKALTAGIGVKTATGSSTETTSSGKYIHAHMQPGTGSWDPLVSLLYTQMANPFLLRADVTHQFSTRNRQGYEFGDSTAVNLGATYAVSSEFNVCAGMTYLHLGSASDRDGNYTNLNSLMDDPANTGGDSLWVSPGIQVLPIKNAMVEMKVQFPVWEDVNGIQLVTRYRLVIGMAYRF